MKTSEIIEQLLLVVPGKQAGLAAALDASQPQVSRWKSGAQPYGDTLQRIHKVAQDYGILPASGQKVTKAAPASKFIQVPLISWVSAGKLIDSDTQIPHSESREISLAGLGSGEFFALTVSGTSMDRISPDKSIIVVNRREKVLQEGKPFVFAVRGEVTYKLWRSHPPRLEPYSTDPSHEPIFIDKRNSLIVIGRVRRSIYDL